MTTREILEKIIESKMDYGKEYSMDDIMRMHYNFCKENNLKMSSYSGALSEMVSKGKIKRKSTGIYIKEH